MNFELKTKNLKAKTLKGLAFISCLTPLGLLGWDAYSDNLGANPIEVITRDTGTWTLIFLLITLSVTPLRRVAGWQGLIKFRRMLGLFAFFYVCLHFTTYIWLDQFFEFAEIVKDVMKRPFITVGFLSFALLIPLALTSTSGMIRRLGKRWQQLHRLTYAIAISGVIHFLWLVKADIRRPLIYGSILTVLLAYRLFLRKREIRSVPLPSSAGVTVFNAVRIGRSDD
ncbi:MAG: sulfoxide reductase heme-binding subunit YedZ [Deltaproteobacteria bacterium]|nr:sulfoxide reductase heme-binding subunit YedZ [Deltaproteobacteria bacterium]